MDITIGYLDDATGSLLLDEESSAANVAADDLRELLGTPDGVGCAKPLQIIVPQATETTGVSARISGYWHDDFMVGPGRRSVVRFQGCPIRCKGCWVPETWDKDAGADVGIVELAENLLDSAHERDGITILGGEPFAQPIALVALLIALRTSRRPEIQIAVYSGYTIERIRDLDYGETILDSIDLLVDGPFVQSRRHSATCDCSDETRRWTGSCNQRIHWLMPL